VIVFYLDEAGCTGVLPTANSPIQPVFVLAGIFMPRDCIKPLTSDLLRLKERVTTHAACQPTRSFWTGSSWRSRVPTSASNSARATATNGALMEHYNCRIIGRLYVKGIADPSEESLTFAWKRLQEAVFGGQGEPQPPDWVFRILAVAPRGVMDGLHPILRCAFLRLYRDETSLYREGTFIPEPAIAGFEVLMRRPDRFAVARSHVSGTRSAVVERMAKGFRTESATVPVVRAIFKSVRQLPEVARRTNRLSDRTLHLREAVEKARAPERFLFGDLPAALGLSPLPDNGPSKQEIERFFNALNECLQEWVGIAGKIHTDAKHALLHIEKKIGVASMRTRRDVTRAALLPVAERLAEGSEGLE
jgi:hypothetical protein